MPIRLDTDTKFVVKRIIVEGTRLTRIKDEDRPEEVIRKISLVLNYI